MYVVVSLWMNSSMFANCSVFGNVWAREVFGRFEVRFWAKMRNSDMFDSCIFCKSKYHNFSTNQNFGAFISLRKSIKKFNKATLPKIFFWSLCTYLCAYLPMYVWDFCPKNTILIGPQEYKIYLITGVLY